MNPTVGEGAHLGELATAVQQKQEAVEADQDALPVALRLALQQAAEDRDTKDSRFPFSTSY